MNTQDKIKVMQAWVAGKTIEGIPNGEEWDYPSIWGPDEEPEWDWERCNYRIKPEPREWTLCNGYDKKFWIVVNEDHCHTNCPGDKVKVREVLE